MKLHLLNELWGGLAAMLVALPSSIAFGVLVFSAISPQLVGEGAMLGMIGAAILGLVAPIFGRTPALISAPCAPAAAVLSGFAIELTAKGLEPNQIVNMLALTALLAALLQIVYGLSRCGKLIKYIPYPVVSGYLSGVGVIIAIGQLPKFFGMPKQISVWQGLTTPELWQWPSIAIGLITMTMMLLAPRITAKIPAAILGLSAGVVGYFILAYFSPSLLSVDANPLVIGPIRSNASFINTLHGRLTTIMDIQIADLERVAYSALTLSALLSIDTLKTCLVLDALTTKRHDSNRELIGQGAANLVSFLTGGMPGSGTMGPTLVNVASGGRQIASGFIEGILVVLVILVLSPLIAWVPIGALAGILLVVAFRMFDWQAFRLLKHRETGLDFAVIFAVVLVAESIGLIAASATGIGLTILLFIRDQIRQPVLRGKASLQEIKSKTHRLQSEYAILQAHGNNAAVYELQGNLFFGTTDHLYSLLEADLEIRKWLLFDMRRVQSLDYTATHLFSLMKDRLEQRGGKILFSSMPSSLPSGQDIERYLSNVGLIDPNGAGILVFETREEGLEWMETQILETTGNRQSLEERPLQLHEIELLHDMDQTTLDALKHCARERSFGAGDNIFKTGDSGDELFLIRRGIVRILLPLKGGKHHHLATFGQGDYFGEMAFLDHHLRSANAFAKTDCDLYLLSRQEFNTRVYENAVLGVRVFARIASAISSRLRQADNEICALEDR